MKDTTIRKQTGFGGGKLYTKPEVSLERIRIEAGFAVSPADLEKDFGKLNEAGKELEINSGYDL